MRNILTLNKKEEFLRVYRNNKFAAGKYIVLYCMDNNVNENRIGIVITKKVGNSVKRNRIRRLIKENYRLIEDELKLGYDMVFVSRKNECIPDFYEIKRELKYVLKKLNMLR